MTTASLAELKSGLVLGRRRLLDAIAGVSEQQFKKRPAATPDDPQPWCIAEVLAHLLHDELVWNQRIELAIHENEAAVTPTDREAADAAVRAGRQAPVPQLIHGLLASRRALERLLVVVERRALLEHRVIHPQRGDLTIGWMAEKVAGHEAEHVEQIEDLKRRIGTETSS